MPYSQQIKNSAATMTSFPGSSALANLIYQVFYIWLHNSRLCVGIVIDYRLMKGLESINRASRLTEYRQIAHHMCGCDVRLKYGD